MMASTENLHSRNFSARLQEALREAGWSQKQLSDYTMINQSTISRWFNGNAEPQPRTVEVIANAIGVRAQWLRTGEPPKRTPGSSAIINGQLVRVAEGDNDAETAASYGSDPRSILKRAREQKGWTHEELAKISRVPAQYIRDVESGNLRGGNEKQLRKLAAALDLSPEALLEGSDHPRVLDETGRRGTFGAIPSVQIPGKNVRLVPLLSWAQAGALDSGFVDEAYDYGATISVDIKDKAFGLTIRGDSMVPEIREGDDVIVCPGWTARNGDTVIARTVDGDVMCKIYQTKEGGTKIVLSSYNPAHPPIELRREEIAWIYPVGQVVRNYRKQ